MLVVPSLELLIVLELQLLETLASPADGEGFWELQSENTWVTHGSEPCVYGKLVIVQHMMYKGILLTIKVTH